jgi:hypothetical protein
MYIFVVCVYFSTNRSLAQPFFLCRKPFAASVFLDAAAAAYGEMTPRPTVRFLFGAAGCIPLLAVLLSAFAYFRPHRAFNSLCG